MIGTIILFVVVLVALIVVHEFGHFVVAKLSGMRVDEFGIGYPPRIVGFKRGETEYTLNWLPFGGFVRIYGEDADGAGPRAFGARPKVLQALTLVAGIFMNLLFAYVLISIALGFGTQRALTDAELPQAHDAVLAVATLLPGSPAEKAGLKPGDLIRSVDGPGEGFTGADATRFLTYIASDANRTPLLFHIEREGKPMTLTAIPQNNVIPDQAWRVALGFAVTPVGTVAIPWTQAPIVGAQYTWDLTKQTAVGLAQFFGNIFTFKADLGQVTGPVGIAGAVGNAAHQGLTSLLTITAIISINLALINLLPIPALDGGRLLFVLIEAIIRRPIKADVANRVNTVGFALLVLLMLVVTAHDLFKTFT